MEPVKDTLSMFSCAAIAWPHSGPSPRRILLESYRYVITLLLPGIMLTTPGGNPACVIMQRR